MTPRKRRQPGQVGSAPQPVSPVREKPNQATEQSSKRYPQEVPRGGEDEISIWADQTAVTQANDMTRCICGKLYKTVRGLKVYQARMKCKEKEKEVQGTGLEPGEMQEEPSQEGPHRAQSLPAPQSPNPSGVVHH